MYKTQTDLQPGLGIFEIFEWANLKVTKISPTYQSDDYLLLTITLRIMKPLHTMSELDKEKIILMEKNLKTAFECETRTNATKYRLHGFSVDECLNNGGVSDSLIVRLRLFKVSEKG